ncbi:MAG TPA: MFS transporter [Steroidobacteraceae bacterium]|jgi:MFS family permease|nr:MFS transporter [Steroidobacteraceae bacterium]
MSVSPQSLEGGAPAAPTDGVIAKAATGAKYALFLLFAINLLNFFDRQLLGALGEPIRHEFDLNDKALGGLGTIFTIIYAFVGLPLGALSDRWYRNRLIALGTTVWSLLTAATGFAQNYAQIFIARLGVGVGEATCAPAGQSLIGDLFPPNQRAKAMGVFMLGLPAGIFLAYISAGAIATKFGWRAAFWFACIPGIILAWMALRMPEPARGALDPGRVVTTAPHSAKTAFATVLGLPTMWWIIMSGIFHNFNMYAINSFNSPFLQRFHQMSLLNASYISAISVGAVGAIGLIVGGWLADKMSAKRRNGRLVLSASAMAIAAPCIFIAINQPKGAIITYVIFMTIGTITMFVYYATVYAAIQDVIEPRLRGTAVAIYFCFMYILGASMGPYATGALSDYFARKAMLDAGAGSMTEAFKAIGLHNAMYIIPILALAAAAVLFAASRTMEKDVRKQQMAHQT